MVVHEAKQARGAHVACGARGIGTCGAWARERDTDGAWRRVLARQKLQAACVGACQVVSGHSWLGFARDWLFCHSMPLIWQLDEQNDDI